MTEVGMSHFLGGSSLNRLSWLRNSPSFLTMAAESPRARWIIFNDGSPLVWSSQPAPGSKSGRRSNSLGRYSTSQIRNLLGPKPLFAQGQEPGTALPAEMVTTDRHGAGKFLEAARFHGPPIVFLGVEEGPHGAVTLPTTEFKNPRSEEDILGDPYFALDVTDLDQHLVNDVFLVGREVHGRTAEFGDARATGLSLAFADAAIFSLARMMIDWLSRNKFCASCGSPLYVLWGGWKLSCSSLLPWAHKSGRKPCPTGKGLHNIMHPRTDPVIITAVLSEDGEQILLGRNKRFPPGFYSTLAGFLEPSESMEDAVAREIWEESGIKVHTIRYHSCQPWPFPANLMIASFALADASQRIRTDLDTELEDARWFTKDEVRAILEHTAGTTLQQKEIRGMGSNDASQRYLAPSVKSSNMSDTEIEEERAPLPDIRLPGKSVAIAGGLIHAWAYNELDGLGYDFASRRLSKY